MKKALILFTVSLSLLLLFSFSGKPPGQQTAAPAFQIDTLATHLYVPWDIVFLPDKSMLFTERPGRVRILRNNQLLPQPALTINDVEVRGKMGLLGLCLHPDFITNRYVYLAYNFLQNDQPRLRVARYLLKNDSLISPQVIIEDIPGSFNHTGCRLRFGPDKKLYITTGDADVPPRSQDLKALNGKILRLNDDGGIPADNPFVHNDTARHEIWTYGHRNSQGIAFQPGTGYLFNSEHGPANGDEINVVVRGHNYGWPVIHHRETHAGMESPLLEFTPSIGPSTALFYKGNAFPALKGNLLVACLRGEAILRIQLNGKKPVSTEFLLKNQFGRIRALTEGPDGYLYISTSMIDPPESDAAPGTHEVDMILRLRPGGSLRNAAQTAAIKAGADDNNALTATSKRSPAILYSQLCASCHGVNLHGAAPDRDLTDSSWLHGSSKPDIIRSIRQGVIQKGMPAWEGVLTGKEINEMADYILKHKKA